MKTESELRDIKECFPNLGESFFMPDVSYDQIIAAMDLYPVIMLEENDYQGDSIALLRSEFNNYGVLTFSWGSCSGCDALQAAETLDDINKLRSELYSKIHWEKDHKDPDFDDYKHGRGIARWWLDRDVAALENVSEGLNGKFCDMLRKYFEIKIQKASPIDKVHKILTDNGIEIQVRSRHDEYYMPWILMKYNGQVVLDEQCELDNYEEGSYKIDFT